VPLVGDTNDIELVDQTIGLPVRHSIKVGMQSMQLLPSTNNLPFLVIMLKSNQRKSQRLEYSRMKLIPPISSIDLMAFKSKMASLLVFQNTVDIN
jgi:hypothetical protein